MIQITPQMRILLATAAVDFRNGIDGLARICKEWLETDPFSGTVFIFRNRRGCSLKVLMYDGQGFWLCQKRLSQGRFRYWPKGNGEIVSKLAVHELQLLLWNGNPASARTTGIWRQIPVHASS
jgi:transposase